MKKLLAVTFLLAVSTLYAAFPTNQNTGDIDISDIDGSWDSLPSWKWAGFDSQYNSLNFHSDGSAVDLTDAVVGFKMSRYEGTGSVCYVNTTNITISTSNIVFTLANTNIPPNAVYKTEIWAYVPPLTNASRTLGQWEIEVFDSLYDDDDATFPWPVQIFATDYTTTTNLIQDFLQKTHATLLYIEDPTSKTSGDRLAFDGTNWYSTAHTPSIGDGVTIIWVTNDNQYILTAVGTLATNAIPYLVHLGTNYGQNGAVVTFSGTAVTRGGDNHLVFTDTGTNGVVPEGRFDLTNTAFWTAINLKASQSDFDGSNTAWNTAFNSSNTAFWIAIDAKVAQSIFDTTNTAFWSAINSKVAQSDFNGSNTAFWIAINADVLQSEFDLTNTAFWSAINAKVAQTTFDLTNTALWAGIGTSTQGLPERIDAAASTNAIQDTNIFARLLPASTNALIHADGSVAMTGNLNMGGDAITNGNYLSVTNYLEVIGSNGVNLITSGNGWDTVEWTVSEAGDYLLLWAQFAPAEDNAYYDLIVKPLSPYQISGRMYKPGEDDAIIITYGGETVHSYTEGAGLVSFSEIILPSSTNALNIYGNISFLAELWVDSLVVYDLTASETIFPKDIHDWKIASTGKTDLVTFGNLSNQVAGAILTNHFAWGHDSPTNTKYLVSGVIGESNTIQGASFQCAGTCTIDIGIGYKTNLPNLYTVKWQGVKVSSTFSNYVNAFGIPKDYRLHLAITNISGVSNYYHDITGIDQ